MSSRERRLVACSDEEGWDAFVAASPQRSAFVRSWYLRALTAAAPDLTVDRWLLLDGAQPVIGAVVLRRGEVPTDAPYPFSPYQSLLFDGGLAAEPPHRAGRLVPEVTGQLAEALAQRYPRLSLCLHPALRDVRGLQWFRHGKPDRPQLDVRFTALIDLGAVSGFDEYLDTIRPTRRNEYRRAVARGLRAEASQDVELLDRLHAATFARQGIERPPAEAALVREIARAALAAGAAELSICRAPSGEVASAVLFVDEGPSSVYLFGANAPEHRPLDAGAFLVLEAIRRAHRRGMKEVDLCGVNSPQRGDFKTSMGASVVPYFLVSWGDSPR
ncbi:MAG: GNAT family N-acetyltransferase [Verrucomicrobiota bacterium]